MKGAQTVIRHLWSGTFLKIFSFARQKPEVFELFVVLLRDPWTVQEMQNVFLFRKLKLRIESLNC